MKCRGEAQKVVGLTDQQKIGLRLGRVKGDNRRNGYKHKKSSKLKTARANREYWRRNPIELAARAAKTRGEKHYRWNGGSSRLNISIRQMTENRKWMDAVKERDKACQKCGDDENLEAHHLTPLAGLIQSLGIKSRDDARRYAHVLWNLDNGITLCEEHHYREHGRTFHAHK